MMKFCVVPRQQPSDWPGKIPDVYGKNVLMLGWGGNLDGKATSGLMGG
jgi:hypothetical protein